LLRLVARPMFAVIFCSNSQIFVFLVITLVHTFLYLVLIFDGLDAKTMQVIKIVQPDFDKIIFTAITVC